ncbi:poly-gamma-glutamate hydrolase family protein [Streptomyces roseifaciens]
MADKYPDYRSLAADTIQGIDYDLFNRYGQGAYLVHIAIHGGGTEPPTSQLAEHCAGAAGPYYSFYAKRARGNGELHIASTRFDEPLCVANVAKSTRTVAWHGYADNTTGELNSYVGGGDVVLRDLIVQALVRAGFSAQPAVASIEGTDPDNICNKNRMGAGVQIEISRSQRAAFYKDGDLTLPSIANPANRTQTFFTYTSAVLAAIAQAPLPVPAEVPRPSPLSSTRVLSDPTISKTMSLPFAIDHTGTVAFTTDPEQQLVDRVQALVATLPGERVMRATYGVATHQMLFAPDAVLADAQLQKMVTDAVARWEPSAVVSAIQSLTNENLGLVHVNVQVSRADVPGAEEATTRTVGIRIGGAVVSTPR